MSSLSPAAARRARAQHIEELLGFPPRMGNVGEATTLGNIEDARAADPKEAAEAKQALIESRIDYIYRTFIENEDVHRRFDLEPADILQVGCLAILEAAGKTDLDRPDPLRDFNLHIPRETGRLIMQSKLIPSVTEIGKPTYTLQSSGKTGVLKEPVVPVPAKRMAALVKRYSDAPPESVENEIFKSRSYQRQSVEEVLDFIDWEDAIVLNSLYRFTGSKLGSIRTVGRWLDRSHQGVLYARDRALRDLFSLNSPESIDALHDLIDDDQTNYGLDK